MKRFSSIIVCTALVTALSVAALASYYAYTQTTLKLRQAEFIQNFFGQYFWRYGVVEAMSLQEGFMLIRIHSTVTQNEPTLVRVYVDEESRILEQHMLSSDGTYTALTKPVGRTLSDISIGMNIAVFAENQPDAHRIYARVLLLGNSL